ncbi:MAG: hypothetical protein HY763_15450 [Planctomycetes bacterium]|nr:hypothetical protein [Planctomycetota bacterium]
MVPPLVEAGVLLLVLLTAGVAAMFLVLFVWRNGYVRGWRAARDHPPTCSRCGYNLSGLSHCRCPECGTSYTLEALWKSAIVVRRVKSENAEAPAIPAPGCET